jgi:uncharacterized protein
MYKPSKFNYYTENNSGELLLYNSYIGVDSLTKISTRNKEYIKDWLLQKNINCSDDNVFTQLVDKGFFVHDYEDENIKLKLLYLNKISNNILTLTILPTQQCNFRCTYCYETFVNGRMKKTIQDSIIKYIKNNIKKYDAVFVSWFGGEPLMAMDIIEYISQNIMDICRKHGKPYVANITTNGYLLDIQTFKRLLKYNVLTYQITLDGLKNTQNCQKPLANGGETFDTVINNLRSIRDVIKTGTFRIRIRTNFTLDIFNDIENYVNYYHNEFSKDKRFSFFIRPTMDWGGESVKTMQDCLLDKDRVALLYEKFISLDKKLKFDIYKKFLNPGGGVCFAGKTNTYSIDPIGNIYKCTFSIEKGDVGVIGKFDDDGNMIIDQYKMANWLCSGDFCENKECSFSANCLMEYCPSKRVISKIQSKGSNICPIDIQHVDSTLKLIDATSDSFKIIF